MVSAYPVAARKAALASLASQRNCTCGWGCSLGCRQERREVWCFSSVVCDFKRNFLIWCKISRIDCISLVRHQAVRGAVGVARVKLVHALLQGALFPLLSGELHPLSLLNSWIFGCPSLGRNRDSSCVTKQFSPNFYRKFYAFLYCLQNLYKTIILKEVKWIKLLWSWNGSCALELGVFFVSRVHMETTADLMSICHLHSKDMNRHSRFGPKSVFTRDGIESSVIKAAACSGSFCIEFPWGSDWDDLGSPASTVTNQ